MNRPAPLVGLLLLSSLLARSASAEGLVDSLPPALQTEGCPSAEELQLSRAAEAVRAAYLPLQPLVRETISGVELRDDPRALAVVRRSLGTRPAPTWSDAAPCHETLCALQAALGGSREAALWMLAIGARGPVASLDQSMWKTGKLSLWRVAELRAIFGALADLPPLLLSGASNLRAFYRVPDGDGLGGNTNALSERSDARLGGGGSISIRDTVWKMEPEARREVIAHELGHQIDYGREKLEHAHYALSHGTEWLGIGGWVQTAADPDANNGYRLESSGEGAWTAASWPSEEMPNSIAQYRYKARLLRDYSPRGYSYAGRYFGRDYLKPDADPSLDAMIDEAGGRLALFRSCAAMVVRTEERSVGGPAELFVVETRPDGSMESATWDRWSFVAHAPCVGTALGALRKLPQWTAMSCQRDPDELWIHVAERLDEIEAAVFEASRAVLAARPPQTPSDCLARSDLRLDCLGGPHATEVAREQVDRLIREFSPSRPVSQSARADLLRAILIETPLFPSDEQIFGQLPLLGDGRALLAACLANTISITSNAGKTDWRFWVRTPPKNDVRGFLEPIRTPACTREYGRMLVTHGVLLEPELVEALAGSAKTRAETFAQEFIKQVLGGWESLRTECGIPAASKPSQEQLPCATDWIAARLTPLVPEESVRPLAEKIAPQLKGP